MFNMFDIPQILTSRVDHDDPSKRYSNKIKEEIVDIVFKVPSRGVPFVRYREVRTTMGTENASKLLIKITLLKELIFSV